MANVTIEQAAEKTPHAATSTVDLSILIVTWNSELFIGRCLRSIPDACRGVAYEVIVHDNASRDATLEQVSGARIMRASTNRGFAAGINAALSQASGEYVLLLNPDCELSPRALTLLVEFLESNPAAAAAAPLLISDNGDSQRDFQLRRLPTLATLATEVLLVHKVFPRNPASDSYRYRDLDLDRPRRIEQPAGAALLLRRSIMEEIGPLDEQFTPAWFEDVDYCRRLAERSREVWVVPAASVRHHGGASLDELGFGEFIDIWYRNMWRYARKWLGGARAEALRWIIVAGMALRCLAAVAGVRPRGLSRRDAIRAWGGVLKKAWGRWSRSSS